MNKKQLIDFENDIAETFNQGKIRAPIHLYSGNENFLINFLKNTSKKMIGFFVLGDHTINVYLRAYQQEL